MTFCVCDAQCPVYSYEVCCYNWSFVVLSWLFYCPHLKEYYVWILIRCFCIKHVQQRLHEYVPPHCSTNRFAVCLQYVMHWAHEQYLLGLTQTYCNIVSKARVDCKWVLIIFGSNARPLALYSILYINIVFLLFIIATVFLCMFRFSSVRTATYCILFKGSFLSSHGYADIRQWSNRFCKLCCCSGLNGSLILNSNPNVQDAHNVICYWLVLFMHLHI